jgi:hypothetical protein
MTKFNGIKLHQLRRKICSMLDNRDKNLAEYRNRICDAGLWRETIGSAVNQRSERHPSESIG